ncbi:NACHT, LRR and PYD domains-containing protein 12-like [Salminus brasiliensis]|uniref:NACHT, LRR and PYD domains-containing protein 12-like n=1 Tax=Salminus brasiliensis TaxID=930266 RepID=UPI003B836416
MVDSLSILLDTLDDLEEKNLKRFRLYLTQGKLDGFKPIPKAHLESNDPTDIASKLIDFYGTEESVKITLCILRKINQNELAERLTNQVQRDRKAEQDLHDQASENPGGTTCPNKTGDQPKLKNLRSLKTSTIKNTKGSGEDLLQTALTKHKLRLKKKFKFIFEGINVRENKILLNRIYTKVQISEGENKGVNKEHEVWQIEKAQQCSQNSHFTLINCNDIFRPLQTWITEDDEDEEEEIRTVLTKGIAGIGKTVSVQKFILDWAEGKANQHVDFVFVLPLRELNLIMNVQCSLQELLVDLNPELAGLGAEVYDMCNVMFIFDGLDESRLQMNCFSSQRVYTVSMKSTVDVIMASLIKGELLSSALVWITSRPAAVNQIPSKYVDRLTEVQGFNDQQKEEYFRKKITDESAVSRIISHIKTTRSLHIMCHIPVFCWISATVLKEILAQSQGRDIPKTLTEMYLNFLLIQTNMKNEKYDGREETDSKRLLESNREVILKLAELAFRQLMRGNIMFYEEDMSDCGINMDSTSVYSGMCTEIFKEESVLYKTKVFCFVHLSVQEFLAALYVFHCFVSKTLHVLEAPVDNLPKDAPLHTLLKKAVDEALKSKNGHLDLFLRFLLGISLDSNQKLLQGLLNNTESSSDSIEKTIQYIRENISPEIDRDRMPKDEIEFDNEYPSPDRSINLFLCLLEMDDHSLYREIQEYLKSERRSEKELSPAHCSAIAYMLQISENIVDELDLQAYNTTNEGLRRLMPAVRNCRRAKLAGCELKKMCCEFVASALQVENSPLRELDLSDNYEIEEGVKLISDGLSSAHCKLEVLRLVRCHFTKESCEMLTSALSISPHLRELDLSNNDLQDTGVKRLSAGLKSANSKLMIMRLNQCNLSEGSCETLASVLSSGSSVLKELDLSNNDLLDSGVELLSAGIMNEHCRLEILRLSGCLITEQGCSSLASALSSNPSHLRELDMSYNHPGESGEKLLKGKLQDPCYKLQILNVDNIGASRMKPGLHKYACELTLDPNTVHPKLALSEDNREVTVVKEPLPYPENPERFLSFTSVLCREGLSGRCYWESEWIMDWSHVAVVGAAYKDMIRQGNSDDYWFGFNDKSWSLQYGRGSCTARHCKKRTDVFHSSSSKRLGVFLDWQAGILSFYSVEAGTHSLRHLHTFKSRFRGLIYAGFHLSSATRMSLCRL